MTIADQVEAVQRALGLLADRKPGPETWNAIYNAIVHDKISSHPHPIDQDKVDDRSEKNIATLHPRVQNLARAIVHAARDRGITIKVIDGSRTYAEQDELFKKRPKVTNARGGQSWHNFAAAFDIGIFNGTKYVPESPLYKVIGALGQSLGLEWGGSWKSIVDEPHFQFNPNKVTLAEARALHDAGKNIFA